MERQRFGEGVKSHKATAHHNIKDVIGACLCVAARQVGINIVLEWSGPEHSLCLCHDGQVNALQELSSFFCPLDIYFLFLIYKAASKTCRNRELNMLRVVVKVLLLRNDIRLDWAAQACDMWILLWIAYKNKNNNNRIRMINGHKGVSIVSMEVCLLNFSSDWTLLGNDSTSASKHTRLKTAKFAAHHGC